MTPISPVLKKDINDATSEFFYPSIHGRRCNTTGLVVFKSNGNATPLTELSHEQAWGLLHGQTVESSLQVHCHRHDIAAWRLSFPATPELDLLRVLAPERMSAEIKAAHARAFGKALQDFAADILHVEDYSELPRWYCETGGRWGPRLYSGPCDGLIRQALTSSDEVLHCPCVVFSSDVLNNRPHLEMTAFMLNHTSRPDGSIRELVTAREIDRHKWQLDGDYTTELELSIGHAIGWSHLVSDAKGLRIVGLPQQVVQRFYSAPALDSAKLSKLAQRQTGRKRLFAEWRKIAEHLGWGPKEAATLLRQMKRARFWRDVKYRCCFTLAHPQRALENAAASLRDRFSTEKCSWPQVTHELGSQSHRHKQLYSH